MAAMPRVTGCGIPPGQSFQSYLSPAHVPVDYVFLEIPFEVLEARPFASAVELVRDVPEEPLGGGVVDAVALA